MCFFILVANFNDKKSKGQKQPPRGVPRKKCSENMQQIYRRTRMPKCDFNKVAAYDKIWDIFSNIFLYECNQGTFFNFENRAVETLPLLPLIIRLVFNACILLFIIKTWKRTEETHPNELWFNIFVITLVLSF